MPPRKILSPDFYRCPRSICSTLILGALALAGLVLAMLWSLPPPRPLSAGEATTKPATSISGRLDSRRRIPRVRRSSRALPAHRLGKASTPRASRLDSGDCQVGG